MILIICIDDNGGMMFNKRRQSQDKILTKKITELAAGRKIWMSNYSKALFEQYNADINIDDNFLSKAADGEFCFAEHSCLEQYRQKTEKLIVFKWNRSYPADVYLDIDLSDFTLESSVDFEGSSHNKITMEVYKS